MRHGVIPSAMSPTPTDNIYKGRPKAPEHQPVEATEEWATSVRASKPPFTIMGTLWGVEAGLRQMRRTRPLETCEVEVGDGAVVIAPTAAEALRVKAFLVVQRNVVRDYLDVVALAEHLGIGRAVEILYGIDAYYADRSEEEGSVHTSMVIALADPKPRDTEVIDEVRFNGESIDSHGSRLNPPDRRYSVDAAIEGSHVFHAG